MNETTVLTKLKNFISGHSDKIERISQLSGGWEAWLQAELADLWSPGEVLREVNAYGPNSKLRADLFFPSTNFIVELKCLSLGQAQTAGHLINTTAFSLYKPIAKGTNTDASKITGSANNGVSILIIPGFNRLVSESIQGHVGGAYNWSSTACGKFMIGYRSIINNAPPVIDLTTEPDAMET